MPKLIIEQPSQVHNYARNNPAFVVYLKADAVIAGLALIHKQLWQGAEENIRSGYTLIHIASGKTISNQERFFPLTLKTKRDGIRALWALVPIANWSENERALVGDKGERARAIGQRMHAVLKQLKKGTP